jgi:hypothetical protein
MRSYATKAWVDATISVYAATVGTETWTQLDNVSLRRTPGSATSGTAGAEPGSVLAGSMAAGLSAASSSADGTMWSTGGGFAWTTDAGSGAAIGAQVEAVETGTSALAMATPIDLRQTASPDTWQIMGVTVDQASDRRPRLPAG